MQLKKIFHPEYFQGNRKKNRYFEGWYYKFVASDRRYSLAFIPGISLAKADPHAFIQAFVSFTDEGKTQLEKSYFRFPIEAFTYNDKNFFIKIGENHFSNDHVSIQLKDDHLSLAGDIQLSELTPIRRNLFSPNIMGFFGYLSFMECYHGVVSMSHFLEGQITMNDTTIEFHHSKGYIEKDWGRSFPRAYVWFQSNHFSEPTTSVLFSYADIPFLGRHFQGLIVNLLYHGKEIRFATYNGSKIITEKIGNGHVEYRVKRGRYQLELIADSPNQTELASPRDGMMIEQIKEGLTGSVALRLYERGKLVYEDLGLQAGIEIMKAQKS